MSLFYKIHLGSIIEQRIKELDCDTKKLCNFLKITETELLEIYKKDSLESSLILKFSKILDYDFFRIYTQHLILHSSKDNKNKLKNTIKTSLPNFKKNVYTQEIIDYILSKITSKEMTPYEIIKRYNIPKTTLYKWIKKYSN